MRKPMTVESAPMLLEAFGPLQAARIMPLAREVPELMDVLFKAGTAAWHVYVIYLLRADHRQDLREFASKIVDSRPEDLLASVFGNDTAGLFRAFGKLSAQETVSPQYYFHLARLSRTGHAIAPILDQLETLGITTIESLVELEKHASEPLMIRAGRALADTRPRRIQDLASLVAILRANDLVDATLEPAFGGAGSCDELFRLGLAALGPLPLACIGVPPTDGTLQAVSTFGDYLRILKRFKADNFSIRHADGVGTILAQKAWFVAGGEVLVGLEVVSRAPKGVVVASIESMQVAGRDEPDLQTRTRIEAEIAALPGVKLVESRLGRVLARCESFGLFAPEVDALAASESDSVAPDGASEFGRAA